MAMMRDGISATLLLMSANTANNAEEAFRDSASAILMHAQENAPWADRTGMARYGMGVDVYTEGTDVLLDLYHTVDYGEWLETIQNGRFATIMPTLEVYGPAAIEDAGGRVIGVSQGARGF